MNNREKLKKLLKESVAIKTEMAICTTDLFKTDLPKLFQDFPTLESISWTQYTPYFMDGDPCEFGVNIDCDCIRINGVYGYDKSDEDLEFHEKVFDQFIKIIEDVTNDVFLQLFGDHAQVTISRSSKGIIVEPCEHD